MRIGVLKKEVTIHLLKATSMLLWKTLLILMFILPVKLEEPHCSKYDFEEKVLEKMVRMEFQLERMKSEIEQHVKTIEKSKLETDEMSKTVQESVEEMKNFQTTLLEKITTEQKRWEEYIENNIGELKNKTSNTLDIEIRRLQNLKDEVEISTVAFKARLTTSSAANTGQAFVFPTTLFNEGGAYNAVTGKFTAPVNGTYMFSIAFCVINAKTLVAGILVDGNKYTVTLFYGDGNYECQTADTVAVLTTGQMVWVEALSSTSSGTILDQDSVRWNTFSGTILHK